MTPTPGPPIPPLPTPGDLAELPRVVGMSVQEMVDALPLGSILDRPVPEVLAELGLPPLPVLPPLPPLPGLPPLPTVDLHQLIKPMTDLLGGFGSGDLGKAGFDPSAIFGSLSTVLETGVSMGQGALELGDKLWTGHAAVGAGGKTAEAGASGAALATQGTGINLDINAAAVIVGNGLAALQGIIASTIAEIALLVPGMFTPAAPACIAGASAAAAHGLAAATATVAATRAALLAPTSKMTLNGTKIPVTPPPRLPAPTTPGPAAPSPFAIANSILGIVRPALSSAVEVPASLLTPVSRMADIARPPARGNPADGADPAGNPRGGAGGRTGGGAGGFGGGIGGGVGALPVALGAARPSMPAALGAIEPMGTPTVAPVRGSVIPAGMPMGGAPIGAGHAARGAGAAEAHCAPDYLVTESNGRELVGQVQEVAPAVLGEDEQPDPDDAPDIELRLGPIGPPATT